MLEKFVIRQEQKRKSGNVNIERPCHEEVVVGE